MAELNTSTSENEKNQLIRLLYMLLFAVVMYFALTVLVFVVIVQFIFALFAGSANQSLRNFSRDLAHFIYQITLYLTYNEDRLPFPFNPLYDEVVTELDEEDETIAEFRDLPPEDQPPKNP